MSSTRSLQQRRSTSLANALAQNWDLITAVSGAATGARSSLLGLLQSIASLEGQIRRDYTNRYPLELLQNAHDAGAEAGRPTDVTFWITPSALLVADQGIGFGVAEILALTTLGRSSKRLGGNRRGTVGYKGVGFTSVLDVTERPQIVSNQARFYLDGRLARARVAAVLGVDQGIEIPSRPFPFQLVESDLGDDLDRVADLIRHGAVTVVRLPYRKQESAKTVEIVVRSQLSPQTLLFMPWIRRLSIRLDGPSETWFASRGVTKGGIQKIELAIGDHVEGWLLAEDEFSIDPGLIARLDDDRWRDVKHLTAAAAVPMQGSKLRDDGPIRPIHVYAPTDETLGRAFILHGDFFLRTDRRHIEAAGIPGEITELVGRRSAALLVRIATATAAQGRPLLDLLAPLGPATEFGSRLGQVLDDMLGRSRIVRVVRRGGPLRRPSDAVRLASTLSVSQQLLLSRVLRKTGDVVRPGDDAGRGGPFITSLGARSLSPAEVAERVDLRSSSLPYERGLEILGRFIRSTDGSGRRGAIGALKKRPIVRIPGRGFRLPTMVYVKGAHSPRLPRWLAHESIALPRGRYASQLLRDLEIPLLDTRVALEILVRALEEGRHGRTDRDRTASLRLVEAVMRSDVATFEEFRGRLVNIRVPATDSAGHQREWMPASATYFAKNFTGSSSLEDVYGKLGRSEFVRDSSRDPRRRDLYAALGVAASPRLRKVSVQDHGVGYGAPSSVGGLAEYRAWRSSPSVQRAWICPEGHDNTPRRVEFHVVDRIDEVLALKDTRASTALAKSLAAGSFERGRTAQIACAHSAHRYWNTKTAEGYQSWTLDHQDWVPVANDPLGRNFCSSSEAWASLPQRGPHLLLPQARLSRDVAIRIGLPTLEGAKFDQVEASLMMLANAYPDLEKASDDVWNTAIRLLKRLDAMVANEKRSTAPQFACLDGGRRCWSREPLVADLPGLDGVPGLVLLPGGIGKRLTATYGLPLASSAVEIKVHASGRLLGERRFTDEARAGILALLERSETESTAPRLARLTELPVTTLRRTVTFGDDSLDSPIPFILKPKRDKLGRTLADADLYWSVAADVDWLDLIAQVAVHLGTPDAAYMLYSYLLAPRAILAKEHISHADLEIATERLGRYHRARPEVEPLFGDEDQADQVPTSDLSANSQLPTVAPPDGVRGRVIVPPQTQERAGDGIDGRVATEVPLSPAAPIADVTKLVFGQPKQVHSGAEGRSASPGRATSRSDAIHQRPASPRTADPVAPDPEIEARAMELVKRYGFDKLGASVRDVHLLNLGWDLEFAYPSGDRQLIEVKGSSGEARFPLTSNELRAAQTEPHFYVYLVCNLRGPSKPRLMRFTGTSLGADHLVPAAYWVDWQGVDGEEIPLTD